MTTSGGPRRGDLDGDDVRGTPVQRLRAGVVSGSGAIIEHLPTAFVGGASDALGELWYRLAPGRAAVARGNLGHLAEWLAAERRGSARARAAATDPAVLERLVRAAFRHAVRTYAETFRTGATAREVAAHLVLETPEAVDAAFGAGGPLIVASLHFGSMIGAASVLGMRATVPVTVPMETIDDPELQRVLRRGRESAGARIIPLRNARRELQAALARGEGVGLVADRDIAGGGTLVTLFGLPASLPIGPALLAVESGAPVHVAVTRRAPGGRFRGRLVTLPRPPANLPRRARMEAMLAAEARAFEELIEPAPEQWSAVFYPIWEAVGPRPRDAAPTAGSSEPVSTAVSGEPMRTSGAPASTSGEPVP